MYVCLAVASGTFLGFLTYVGIRTYKMWKSYEMCDVLIPTYEEDEDDDDDDKEHNYHSLIESMEELNRVLTLRIESLEQSNKQLEERVDILETNQSSSDDDSDDDDRLQKENMELRSRIEGLEAYNSRINESSSESDDDSDSENSDVPEYSESTFTDIQIVHPPTEPRKLIVPDTEGQYMPPAHMVPENYIYTLSGIEAQQDWIKKRLQQRGMSDKSITNMDQYMREMGGIY